MLSIKRQVHANEMVKSSTFSRLRNIEKRNLYKMRMKITINPFIHSSNIPEANNPALLLNVTFIEKSIRQRYHLTGAAL